MVDKEVRKWFMFEVTDLPNPALINYDESLYTDAVVANTACQ